MSIVPTNYPWLETAHFCDTSGETLLLRWDRPSGTTYRTGRWCNDRLRYIGSGDVEFRTQPTAFLWVAKYFAEQDAARAPKEEKP